MSQTLCRKPFMVGGMLPAGCYSCPACRVKRKKLWASRIYLESRLHEKNAFATLTYSDENLPKAQCFLDEKQTAVADSSLIPRHLQLFLKKLRLRSPGLRFFAAGEYGTQTSRPHYHVALFNYGTCYRGSTDMRLQTCCSSCEMVKESWGLGGIQLGELNEKTSAYIAKYVVKGWTKETEENKDQLRGRYPEFTRMSLKHGIGHGAIGLIAGSINDDRRVKGRYGSVEDVPFALQQGNRSLPLGNYLRRGLRKVLDISPDGLAPVGFSKKYWQEMRELRKAATSDPTRSPEITSFSKYIVALNTQNWYNKLARMKIKTNQGVL